MNWNRKFNALQMCKRCPAGMYIFAETIQYLQQNHQGQKNRKLLWNNNKTSELPISGTPKIPRLQQETNRKCTATTTISRRNPEIKHGL